MEARDIDSRATARTLPWRKHPLFLVRSGWAEFHARGVTLKVGLPLLWVNATHLGLLLSQRDAISFVMRRAVCDEWIALTRTAHMFVCVVSTLKHDRV